MKSFSYKDQSQALRFNNTIFIFIFLTYLLLKNSELSALGSIIVLSYFSLIVLYSLDHLHKISKFTAFLGIVLLIDIIHKILSSSLFSIQYTVKYLTLLLIFEVVRRYNHKELKFLICQIFYWLSCLTPIVQLILDYFGILKLSDNVPSGITASANLSAFLLILIYLYREIKAMNTIITHMISLLAFALFSSISVIPILFVFYCTRVRFRRKIPVLGPMTLAIAVFGIFYFVINKYLYQVSFVAENLDQLKFEKASGLGTLGWRLWAWYIYFDAFIQNCNPVFGCGIGATYFTSNIYVGGIVQHAPHNSALSSLVETGLFGFILFLSFLYWFWWKVFASNYSWIIGLTGLIPVFLGNMYGSEIILITMLVLVGLELRNAEAV